MVEWSTVHPRTKASLWYWIHDQHLPSAEQQCFEEFFPDSKPLRACGCVSLSHTPPERIRLCTYHYRYNEACLWKNSEETS